MAIKGGEIITEYKSDLRDLERGARRAEQIAEQSASRISRSLSGAFGGRGGGGVLPGLANISNIIQGIPQIGNLARALLDPLKQATEEGIRFNMMVESAEVGFVGVAKGIENARKHVAALRQFGEDSPLFNSEGLIRTSRLMNVFGFELSEHIQKIKIWGDAIASSGEMSEETLLGVARAFGQMKSLGRVNAEEMNQLAERGIPAWELLAKAIGKTVAETRKLGEQGKLRGGPAVEAITAMIGEDPRFKGTAERLAGTLEGRLARVGEIRERAQGIATQGLTQDISGALAGALTQEDLAVKMAGGINAAIAPISGVVRGAIVSTVGGGLSDGFEEAFNAAKAVLPAGATTLATEGVIKPLLKAFGIESPSKVTYNMGLMLAAGLQDGFADGLSGKRFSDEIEKIIAEAAAKFGLDPNLIREVIRKESRGNPRAVSPVGARGLMQLMPGTASRFGVTNSFDPRQNVMGGSAYLRFLLDMFGGSENLALAGYNAGEGAVLAHLPNRPDVNSYVGGSGRRFTVSEATARASGGIPQNRQTLDYVSEITQRLSAIRSGEPLPVKIVDFGGLSPEQQRNALIEMMSRNGGVPLNFPGHGFGEFTPETLRQLQGRLPPMDYERLRAAIESGGFGTDGAAALPFNPGLGSSGILSLLSPQSTATDFRQTTLSATETQFALLRAIGQIGPTAENAFGQASEATRNWAAEVIDNGNKAASVFGITAADASRAFQDAWLDATSNVEGGVAGMFKRLPLYFAQSLLEMANQWAASQMSSILGGILKTLGGAVAGALFGGAVQGSARINTTQGFQSFFGGGPAPVAPPGFAAGGTFTVGGYGGTDSQFVGFMATPGERVDVRTPGQQRTGGPQAVHYHKHVHVSLPMQRPTDSYQQRRSTREVVEGIAGLLN